MIIDKISLGGDKAYFVFPKNGGGTTTNPAGYSNDVTATIPGTNLGKGMQYAVGGISLQLEADDLSPLFRKQDQPVFRINVYKEMFTCLFANPYEHRVHNISGYEDFNRGKYRNCKAIDIEGVPTLVSLGDDDDASTADDESCEWHSPIYQMPENITFDKVAWDLAASRLTPVENFTYSLKLEYWTTPSPFNQRPMVINIITDASPQAPRINENLNLSGQPLAFRLVFSAKIRHEANLYESHTLNILNTMGTPLLRAIYLLELVPQPLYEFYSLKEVLDHCSDYHLSETPGPKVTKLMATIAMDALLVQSDNEIPPTPVSAGVYERIEFVVCGANNHFTYIETKAHITESITPPKAIE